MNSKQPQKPKNADTAQVSPTAEREEAVVTYWREHDIFNKTLEKDAPGGEFVFYDGPPFATGLPHWGSLLSSVSKDVVGRYKTMRGYNVPRRWGWDCHGLPIENMIEKKLGLKTKKDIEELGIDRFNEEARSEVLRFADDWKRYVDRVGRWVDFDHSYKTLDNTYIESVWWALKKINDDKRLYEGRKVLMYCPRCETPLSKAEIAMDNSYKDVTDEALFVRFKLRDKKSTYVLAWTTTPWTLPSNVALAVGAFVTYVRVKHGEHELILAKERLEVLGDGVEVLEEMKGSDLVGLSYEPLYSIEKAKSAASKALWTILDADFVTTEDGSGVVHIAPMYGEDDYALGVANDLPTVPLLDATGTFNGDAPEIVQGMYYKKGGKYVTEDLEGRNLVFGKHPHLHSYPHCYRCGTALIYNALTSWFVDIQSVKDRLLEANEEVNWYPEHLKHGRFYNNLKTAPDWTISRNRFWASPLPIWKHETTDEIHVLGSLSELREYTKKSGNTYLVMRHGEAESNVKHVVSSHVEDKNPLTDKGTKQVLESVSELKQRGITKILYSPLVRTRETALLIARELGLASGAVVADERLQEWQLGDLSGKPVEELRQACPTYDERLTRGCGTGESLMEMKRRIGEALYDLEQTHTNETVLIVGHEYTAWFLECVAKGADNEACVSIRGNEDDFIKNAEVRVLDFVPLPHNKEYELDLHRPYIDTVELVAADGGRLVRIPEVVDCWMESGSMPFASEHFPHENTDLVKRRYPGDFISEYIAQTRTWFYYMHALGVLLFDAPSFKNVVTTGNLLAADGAKMSKSKGNYTDPLVDMDRYGADAARLYIMGSVVMQAEDTAFKEEELREAHNRFVNMLWNSFNFYSMYKDGQTPGVSGHASTNVLDQWILARLQETAHSMTEYMDAYDTVRTARSMRDFVSDLSTWYIRRSRDRFKSDDEADKQQALATTQYVFTTFARLIAPITPFVAEDVYRGAGGEEESVHLDSWPEATSLSAAQQTLIDDMAEIRRVSSLVLDARQAASLKVRQPLAKVTLKATELDGKDELLELLAGEVNVKEVQFGSGFDEDVLLDTELTPELVAEGQLRELVRAVQDMRKRAALMPEDLVALTVATDAAGMELVERAKDELERVCGVAAIQKGTAEGGQAVALGGSSLIFVLTKQAA